VHHAEVGQHAAQVAFHLGDWHVGVQFWGGEQAVFAAGAVIGQALLAALQGDFTTLDIVHRQLWSQHIVLAGQNGHGVDVLHHKLAVSHPQAHIGQIARVKARLLHGLIQ